MGRPRLTLETLMGTLSLISEGYTEAQAAKKLGISHGGVRKHMRRTFHVLNARSAAHAVAIAMSNGLLPPVNPQPSVSE